LLIKTIIIIIIIIIKVTLLKLAQNVADDAAGAPHTVAIATTDASVSGVSVAMELVHHQSTSSTTSSGQRRHWNSTKPSSWSHMTSGVPRSSACRQQCCDDSPMVALRVFHDQQRLSRTASMTSPPEAVTLQTDHAIARPDGGGGVDPADESDSELSCQPD